MSNSPESDKIDQTHDDQSRAGAVKRPYDKPVVLEHGNLRSITLAAGDKGALDAGSPEDVKTGAEGGPG